MVIKNKLVFYIEKIDELNVLHDYFLFFKNILNDISFKNFCVIRNIDNFKEFSEINLINNLDPDFINMCDEGDFTSACVFFRYYDESYMPFMLELGAKKSSRAKPLSKRSAKIFQRFGMTKSVCYPVFDHSGQRGGVSFSGGSSFPVDEDLYALHIICQYAYHRMRLATGEERRLRPRLSKREVECLNWTAVGKTSSETAAILQLSDHTVTHYLTSASRKLNATNRVHAVAKAIRLGLLP